LESQLQLNLPAGKIVDSPFRYTCSITDQKYKKNKPVYAIAFNPFTHRKIFAAAVFSRVLIMSCPDPEENNNDDNEYNGLKELKVYEVENDSFFAVSWGFDTNTAQTLLAAGGQNGIIRIVEGFKHKNQSDLKGHSKFG
jgi:hypothetical protein